MFLRPLRADARLRGWWRGAGKALRTLAAMPGRDPLMLQSCCVPSIRGHRSTPSLSASAAAGRLEKHGQSISITAWAFTDAALSEPVVIDGHAMRPEISSVRFT